VVPLHGAATVPMYRRATRRCGAIALEPPPGPFVRDDGGRGAEPAATVDVVTHERPAR
jgi:hypothetical protein